MKILRMSALVLVFLAASTGTIRTVTLRFDPPKDQLSMYAMYTRLDGDITKPQDFEGLRGFTRALFSSRLVQKNYCAATSEINFSAYDFNTQAYSLGGGEEQQRGGGPASPGGGGGGGAPGGGGGGPGGPGTGAGGSSSSDDSGSPMDTGGSNGSTMQYPGGGGGGGGGASRGGGAAPSGRLDISNQLTQGLTLIQNCKGEVLGSRGAELTRIKEPDVSSQSMDQLLELAFSFYYPDKPVTLGDSWTATKYFTMLGVRNKRPISLKYTVWPRFDIGAMTSVDEDFSSVFNSNRYPLAYSVMSRLMGNPGYTSYGLDPVAIITYGGADIFDDSETEETEKLHIDRTFQGKFNTGAIVIYDYKNNTPILISISHRVQYYKKEQTTPVSPDSYLKPTTGLSLVKYTLDFDLLRISAQSPPRLMTKVKSELMPH